MSESRGKPNGQRQGASQGQTANNLRIDVHALMQPCDYRSPNPRMDTRRHSVRNRAVTRRNPVSKVPKLLKNLWAIRA